MRGRARGRQWERSLVCVLGLRKGSCGPDVGCVEGEVGLGGRRQRIWCWTEWSIWHIRMEVLRRCKKDLK